MQYTEIELDASPWLQMAKSLCEKKSKAIRSPNGCVIVNIDDEDSQLLMGIGANGSDAHKDGCLRKKNNVPSGVAYDICPSCCTFSHGEMVAVRNALGRYTLEELLEMKLVAYMYNHYFCCDKCVEALKLIGVTTVFIEKDAMNKVLERKSKQNDTL